MDQLRDIQGLQPISWWPLAYGWWFLIVLAFCIIAYLSFRAYKNYKYNISWQGQAYKKLQSLESNLEGDNAKANLQMLSTTIRQIAMHSATRHSCAGLAANSWLQWLQDHDPQSFGWTTKGQILITEQYSQQQYFATEQIKEMIDAIKVWVRRC